MNPTPYNPLFDTIADDCLDDLLSGRRTIAECLAAYPEHAEALKPVLEIGLLTARLKTPEMSSSSVDALEARLRAQMSVPKSNRPLILLPLAISKLAASIAIVLFLAFGSGAGLVAASADTVPGDALYVIKRFWESIILLFSPLTGQADDLWLHFAQVRLEEIQRLEQQGKLTKQALEDLRTAAEEAYKLADAETKIMVDIFLPSAYQQLQTITPPADSVTILRDTLNWMQTRSQVPPLPLVTPSPTMTASPTQTATHTPTAVPTTITPPSATPTLTATSRFAATATRTPSPIPSATPTITPSITPTQTWTPLPLPQVPTIQPQPTITPPPPLNDRSTPIILPTVNFAQERATQQSVYMTQTAESPDTTPNAP